ncbi:hypothetical protein DINM_005387 [Dirofilaria immitis]|nr:hypothetical protein [Dirofilaria immitis]MCP9262092.1 hypothetical protein [Dirofilaria immitis]
MVIGLCSRDRLYSRALILITSQLIICSFLNFIPQITIVLFGMLKTEIDDVYVLTWIHSIFASMNTFSFFAMLHFTLLLAVNRLVAINLPKFNAFSNQIRYVWVLTLPITMFAVYIPIFYHMRRKRKRCEAKSTVATSKYERLMLIQAVLICGAIEIQTICFNFLMKFAVKFGGKKSKFLSIFLSIAM